MKLKSILDYKKLIIFIFIILLLDKTDFIKNFIKVITVPYSDRLIKIYGYCGGESIGYLMYLKKIITLLITLKLLTIFILLR